MIHIQFQSGLSLASQLFNISALQNEFAGCHTDQPLICGTYDLPEILPLDISLEVQFCTSTQISIRRLTQITNDFILVLQSTVLLKIASQIIPDFSILFIDIMKPHIFPADLLQHFRCFFHFLFDLRYIFPFFPLQLLFQ